MASDGFTVVKSKRRIRKNPRVLEAPNCKTRDLGKQEDDVDSDEIYEKVLKLKSDVLTEQYTDTVKERLKQIKRHFLECSNEGTTKIDFISYGIGNFASCLIARYQLALLLIMRDELLDSLKECEVYDPIFNTGEKEILLKLNMTIIPENEEGKRKVVNPTLFYMPHCGKALYNNLLWANWSPVKLGNVVIIGNSFSQILESIPSSILIKEASHIYKIGNYVDELPLENTFRFDDIFNNTSIHTFKREVLSKAEDSLWIKTEEPIYDSDNVEIILSK